MRSGICMDSEIGDGCVDGIRGGHHVISLIINLHEPKVNEQNQDPSRLLYIPPQNSTITELKLSYECFD